MTQRIQEAQSAARSRGCRAMVLLAGLLSAACGDAEAEPAPPAEDAGAWQVAGPPRTVIGADETKPGHELHRVYAGLLRGDGGIVVANSGSSELRFFDAAGRLRAAAGREGGGPGEFRGIQWISRWRGDSILAYDMRQRRFSVLDAAGTYGRTFSVASPQPIRPVGTFSDGTLLIAAEAGFDPRGGAGVVRDTLHLLRVGARGEPIGTITSVPGAEWLLYDAPDSFRSAQLPFGHTGRVALAGDHVVYASSERAEIEIRDTTGALVRRIPVPAGERRLSADEVEAWLEEIASQPAERAAVRRHLERAGRGAAPRMGGLRVDGAGRIWVQIHPPAESDGARWIVLDARGATLGSILLPRGETPLDAAGDRILVRGMRADGGEQISVYAVEGS